MSTDKATAWNIDCLAAVDASLVSLIMPDLFETQKRD